jgi:hypothetical protein
VYEALDYVWSLVNFEPQPLWLDLTPLHTDFGINNNTAGTFHFDPQTNHYESKPFMNGFDSNPNDSSPFHFMLEPFSRISGT